MIAGLLKALVLTVGPGLVLFAFAQSIRTKKGLAVYALATVILTGCLYAKIYEAVPAQKSEGFVFTHSLVHCMAVLALLGIIWKLHKLRRKA